MSEYKSTEFHQEDFCYRDLYSENDYLRTVLSYFCDPENFPVISNDIAAFSKKAATEILELMWQAERNPPKHIPFDPWGKRIDRIEMDRAWNRLHAVAAREGLIALPYEQNATVNSRLHQFFKLMIFHPSSAFYTCPLAMTDGVTRVLQQEAGPLKARFFAQLTSRNESEFITAGQWMTEKSGGSDVSQSETVAREECGRFFLYGTKWFTSAITAEIALTLAQTEVEGKQRLSLFLVELRDENGNLNKIEVLSLKDKLGTRAMPTAELQLQGTPATLIGKRGEGVREIASVLNISRLHNSVCATGTIVRLQSLARDYARRRSAFNQKLIDLPLHQETLADTQVDTSACVLFVSELATLLGKTECEVASANETALLRLFTPILKLWTAKKAIRTVSELIECFGGAGYIEDTNLPRFLRDAQVFSIWEGTTNILSLDVLRSVQKESVYGAALSELQGRIAAVPWSNHAQILADLLGVCDAWVTKHRSESRSHQGLDRGARALSLALGDCYSALLLLEFAAANGQKRDETIASRFIAQLRPPQFPSHECDLERFF